MLIARLFRLLLHTDRAETMTVFDLISTVPGAVASAASVSVAFFAEELAVTVFTNYVKQRVIYYWRLRKNYEEIACCLSEDTKPLTLAVLTQY